jgi:hypothetical protein
MPATTASATAPATTTRVLFDATRPDTWNRNTVFAIGLPDDPTVPASPGLTVSPRRTRRAVRLVAGPTRSRLRKEAAIEYGEIMKELAMLAAQR